MFQYSYLAIQWKLTFCVVLADRAEIYQIHKQHLNPLAMPYLMM